MLAEFLDLAPQMGIAPLVIFGINNKLYANGAFPDQSPEALEGFAKFCESVVTRYRGKCRLYQLWNEWDNGRTPEGYVKVAETVYPRLKKLDPSAIFLSNAFCLNEEYVEAVLKRGGLKYCDGIDFHPYVCGMRGKRRCPEAVIARMARIAALVKKYNGGKEFPVYATEVGWPDFDGETATPTSEAGDFIARLMLLGRTVPALKGIWWYDFQNNGWNCKESEHNYGLVKSDGTPKEPYYVIRSISEIVRRGMFVEKLKSTNDNLIALRFRMPDGRDVLAAWTTSLDSELRIRLKNTGDIEKTLDVFHAGFAPVTRHWGARDWTGLGRYSTPEEQNAPLVRDELEFSLTSRPLMITGDLQKTELGGVKEIPFPRVPFPVVKSPKENDSAPPPLSLTVTGGTGIGEFKDRASDGWTFDSGCEFGVSGGGLSFEADPESPTGYVAVLNGDFSTDGSYVAMYKNISGDLPFENLSFRLKTPVLYDKIYLRLEDATGQVFQHIVPVRNTREWQPVILDSGNREFGKWNGANDGVWHNPIRRVGILLNQINMKQEYNVGGIAVADIRLNAEVPKTLNTGWSFYPGSEFKGASGSLSQSSGGAWVMAGDFTGGGKYVAMTGTPMQPVPFDGLRFNLKTADAEKIVVQLTDSTGQTHQQVVALSGSEKWQTVEVKNYNGDRYGKWGGANDGNWHGNLTKISILLDRDLLRGKAKTGKLEIADLIL